MPEGQEGGRVREELDPMDELDILAGPYLEPYWDDFVKFENEVRHVRSWSWGACLLGFFWFMPRRLYGLAFLSVILLPSFMVIASLFHNPVVLPFLYAGWVIVRGKYGKYAFYRSLKNKARQVASLHDPSGHTVEYIQALNRAAITDSSRSFHIFLSILLGFFLFGILMAIIIPGQFRYCAKSKQSEAKTNLKGIFTAQISYFGEHRRYGNTFDEIEFKLAGNRAKIYTFGLGTQRIGVTSDENNARLDELITGFDNTTGFVTYAVGNIDADPTLDVWSIDADNNLVNLLNDLKD